MYLYITLDSLIRLEDFDHDDDDEDDDIVR